MIEGERQRLAAERSMGGAIPRGPFEAMIVGMARGPFAHDWVAAEPGDDGHDAAFEDCTGAQWTETLPIGIPLYEGKGFVESVLPPGVGPPRYRWRALNSDLSSEGCGWRKRADGVWAPWNQALYAVNISETFQARAALDYGRIENGRIVVNMVFGLIGTRTLPVDTPKWGFYFAAGFDNECILVCPNQSGPGGDPLGCCFYIDPQSGVIVEACTTILECSVLGGTWDEGAISCDGSPCGPGG